jgi:hypothetical protein
MQYPAPTHTRTGFTFALPIALFFIVYVYLYDGSLTTLLSWSRVVAGTAAILLGFSLGIGSYAYYTDTPVHNDVKKQLGHQAFWASLLYSCMLCFLFPARYWYGLWDNLYTADVALGLLAMTILGVMTFITERPWVGYVGEHFAYSFLTMGYIAYALLVMRAVFIEWEIWMAWVQALNTLPPPRILLSLFALTILCMRAWVPVHKAYYTRFSTSSDVRA